MKLQKGDEVKIMSGKDKGKTGKIDRIFPKLGKVAVPGINEFKRHVKAKTQTQKSEIVTITKPIFAANVRLVCPKCHEITRVGYVVDGEKKMRRCKKCEETI